MATAPADPVKLLHVAGLHGTGSTILANILGELDGFFNAGELAYLWQALDRPELCGCGRPVPECDVWSSILGSVFLSTREARARLRPRPAWIDAARLPALALEERRADPDLARYRADLSDVCRAICDVTGARVIIETSKHPPFGRVLARAPGIDASVLHLVRDPRASTHAWLRMTRSPLSPLVVGAMWTTWHAAVPRLWRGAGYLAVRYEDFVTIPRRTVLDILGFLELPASDLPFVDEHTVHLRPNHMPAGNQNRFRSGLVEVTPRDEWRGSLGHARAAATMVMASPLLRRWGYRLHR